MFCKQIFVRLFEFLPTLRHVTSPRISAAHGSAYCMLVDLHDLGR